MNKNLKIILGTIGVGLGTYAIFFAIAKSKKKLPVFNAGEYAGLTPEQRYEKDKKDSLNLSIGISAFVLISSLIFSNIDIDEVIEIKPYKKQYHRGHNRINKLKFAK